MGEASVESDGKDAFVVYDGVRIAKRGQPNTPEAGTWVPLEPGFRVFYTGCGQRGEAAGAFAQDPAMLGGGAFPPKTGHASPRPLASCRKSLPSGKAV